MATDDEKESKQEERALPETSHTLRWLQNPAIYCDTFTVDTWEQEGVTRISFGESTVAGYAPFFRCSVVLPIVVAKELVTFLNISFKDAEARKAAQAKEAEEATKKST